MKRGGKAKFHADGVLVMMKPEGPTSHDVVARLRRRFKPAKLGHAGTLDPFASGVLVMAFNQMTRLAELLGSGDKVYRGRLAMGSATDTGDPTGEVVETAPVPEVSEDAARAAVEGLLGNRLQSPPAYSAAKHQGRPLYAYARKGQKVEKPPKPIRVESARLLRLEPGALEFELTVSRGTYVRSLAEDLAVVLGTVGHLASLERVASLPFTTAEALGLDEAMGLSPEELMDRMHTPAQALSRCGVPAVKVDEDTAWELRQGMIMDRQRLAGGQLDHQPGQAFQVWGEEEDLVAVLRWVNPGQDRAGRDYETVRVFPSAAETRPGDEASASAMGAE